MRDPARRGAFYEKRWFYAILVLGMLIPPVGGHLQPASTVLSSTLALSVPLLAPLTKLLLAAVLLLPFAAGGNVGPAVVGYYGGVLVLTGFLQNMGFDSQHSFVWLAGNTFVQLSLAACCFYDMAKRSTRMACIHLDRRRQWVVVPAVLALLMPYSVDAAGIVRPPVSAQFLWNEAGLTYGMVTPVLLALLILYRHGTQMTLLRVLSFAGLLFGLLNLLTWFVFWPADWWMGVLYIPLTVLSAEGLRLSQRETRNQTKKQTE